MLAAPPFNLLSTLDKVDEAIDANADIAIEILKSAVQPFKLESHETDGAATPHDLDKARSTIRQLYRDWSAEGAAERAACYDPVVDEIRAHEIGHVGNKEDMRVLVPGAGLGRLVFEICRHGYSVEGNEISYHQLMASNWILNHTIEGQQHDLYPFALEFSNVRSREDQLMSVKIPDVHPSSRLRSAEGSTMDPTDRMSMTAADFVVLYSQPMNRHRFDVVATVFFIDTAPNLIRYIKTVRNCLMEGGIWINHGPLLWHFGDRAPGEYDDSKKNKRMGDTPGIEEPGSFELTDEEVRRLVTQYGFEVETLSPYDPRIRNDMSGYIQNPNSMLHNVYRKAHWVARKRTLSDDYHLVDHSGGRGQC